MDKTGITVVVVCFILLAFWLVESEKLAKERMLATPPVTTQAPTSVPGSGPVSAEPRRRSPLQQTFLNTY